MPAKSLFIADKPEEKEVTRREIEQAGLNINYIDGRRFLGGYFGTMEELEEWVYTKVESWAYGIRTLDKIANQYPQLENSNLGMSLQIEW